MDIDDIVYEAGVSDVDLSGETVLVTGSTSGIGKYTAQAFGSLGADVIVHGRNAEAGAEVVDSIVESGGTAVFMECDFADLESVVSFAEAVEEYSEGELAILSNNAGGYFTHSQPKDDELNYTFVVNHLAPFVLTQHLLPLLKESESYGRIVNTSSGAHRAASYNPDQAFSRKNSWNSYCHSKLLNLIFTKQLARTEPDIRSVAIHPGAIPGSGFARNLPSFVKPLGTMFANLPLVPVKEPQDGSVPIVYGALNEAVESGAYLTETRLVKYKSEVDDVEVQESLWELSVEAAEEYLPSE